MNAGSDPLELRRGFSEAQRLEAARLYFAAFERKLAPALGAMAVAIPVIAWALELDRGLAVVQGNRLVGIVGLNYGGKRFVNLTSADLVRQYGFWRGWISALLLATLERPVTAGQLLLDGIAVVPEWRGAGIGTRLLLEAEMVALEQGFKSVRLDVVDTNPSAGRLYQRLGYIEMGQVRLPWPLTTLWGFHHSRTMVKALP